jgi:predicted ATPase
LLRLTPKALAVIAELASRPGEVVTKNELFESVWPDTTVSDAALVTCIQEIRRALRDNAARPRFIETVHRRGYRFLHTLEKKAKSSHVPGSTDRLRHLVGRAKELEELTTMLARAQGGARQIVFVSGDAGIGKTSVVEAFLGRAGTGEDLQIAFGQSIERHETSEAYQPLLEALTRWGRESKLLFSVLERHAPTWLAQLPSLLSPERLRQFERRTAGSTRERMLRELTEALEAAATAKPLILLLEDLHWADISTLDWLATFARRREPAAVLVVATDRPVELITAGHPLRAIKQELLAQGCARELALRDLTREDTFDYVRARFPPALGMDIAIAELATRIHGHTEGRPLLMVSVADDLVAHGQLASTQNGWVVEPAAGAQQLPVPKNVDRIVEGRIEKLDDTARYILEIAGVGGIRISAAALATAAGMPVIECEALCASIAASTQLIVEEGADEWPDGTLASRFAFAHALYRDAIYRRIPAARRQALHHRIGLRLEQGYGARAGEIAGDLAMHFERSRDFPRAVHYLFKTGETAMRRSASLQALSDFEKALRFLERLAPSRERDETEAKLRIASGSMQMAISGWGAPQVMGSFVRARSLCELLGFPPHLFPTLWGTWVSYLGQGSVDRARAIAEQLIGLATKTSDPSLILQAEHATWTTHFAIGDLERAHRHAQAGLSLYRVNEHAGLTPSYGNHDAGVCCRMIDGRVLAALGRAGEARKIGEDALRLAAELQHPFTRALALYFVSAIYQVLGELDDAVLRADEAIALSRDHGFRLVELWATVISGSATATSTDARRATLGMRQAIETMVDSGSDVFLPYHLGLLAHAQLAAGDLGEGLATAREGLVRARRTGERFYEAELLRLQAALLLAQGATEEACSEAEALFRESLAIARRQKAHLFTLRTSLSFAQLRIAQRQQTEAGGLLRLACTEIGDQPELADFNEARDLLVKCGC